MKLILFLSLICILIIGCSKEVIPTKPPVKTGASVNPNAVIIGKDISSGDLISIDSTHLIFTANSAEISKLKVGSVLVGGISGLAKYGFLRNVVSISNSNGQIICLTTQGSFVDAVNNCNVTFSQPFSDSNVDSLKVSKFNGGKLRSSSIITGTYNKSFTQNFDDIFYDADGNTATTYDQIFASGSITLSATFNFQLSIGLAKVTKFKADILLSSVENLNLQANVTDKNLSAESTVMTYYMTPVAIDVVGVPLVIVPQINVVIGVDGKITALVTAGVKNTSVVDPGIDFQNGTWTNISSISNSFVNQPIQFQGAASIEPYIQAQLEFRPYGIPNSNLYNSSFYIGAKAFLDAQATANSTGITESLKWGFAFTGLAQLSIFDHTIVNYNPVFLQEEYPITGTQVTVPAYPSINNGSLSDVTQISASFKDTITSAGGLTIIARGVCWSTSPNPTISSNKTSNGTGTGSFSSTITGLTTNTNYYVRGYATNSAGTSYGSSINFTTKSPRTGVTVAGNGGYGNGQFKNPIAVSVDAANNIFVGDLGYYQVQEWTPNAASGIVVAGGNGCCRISNQCTPEGVYADSQDNVYVADASGNRVQKWAPGATAGVTIANGSAANQLAAIANLSLDKSGNLYILDQIQGVVKWIPGASSGVTVAGVNGPVIPGQTNCYAVGMCLDASGNIYIADYMNNVVQKWAPDATSGVTVAGGNGAGSAANQLSSPEGVCVDSSGNIYVCDSFNNRVQKWAPGASSGVTVAGGNGTGAASNQLNYPVGICLDASGNIYIVDNGNFRVQKWPPL